MIFKNYKDRTNILLNKTLIDNNSLSKTMRYSVLAQGKRFRAILCYVVASSFNTKLDLIDSSACALEIIHAYSLIHDDLPAMDDDDLRHNQPSCHKKFGEALAILAGDGLQALAFDVLANDNLITDKIKIDLIKILSNAAFDMAIGQAIDLSVVGKNINIDTLENMHNKKTGALICACVDMSTLISKCSKKDANILHNFAKNIGLAYQIQDDVLELETPNLVFGKNQHSDLNKNKPTYPSILGLDNSKDKYKNLYKQAYDELQKLNFKAQELEELCKILENRSF